MEISEIKALVEKMYRKPEKKKLSIYYDKAKRQVTVTSIHKFILNLAGNIGAQKQMNEDIEDNMTTQMGETQVF